jgi:hypothetical protein
MPQRTTVFVSYSHRDLRWLRRLQVHLKPFGARGDLVLWDDTKLDPGDRWRAAISDAIERAAASILLISADFLASDFVTSEELPRLLERAETAGARIIPIIVQPCRLANHPDLTRFQSLNPLDQPLSKVSDAEAEEVFVRVAEQVERVLRLAPQPKEATSESGDRSPETADANRAIFRELESATIALSVLVAVAKARERPDDYTLTELTRMVDASSRKVAYAAVERLAHAGWIRKHRASGRTGYRIADEGFRQLQRLAAVADGPLRHAVAPS